MTTVGQIEKKTQARVVALFQDRLNYDYLGNWIDRPDNRNIEPEYLTAWLKEQGVVDVLIGQYQQRQFLFFHDLKLSCFSGTSKAKPLMGQPHTTRQGTLHVDRILGAFLGASAFFRF